MYYINQLYFHNIVYSKKLLQTTIKIQKIDDDANRRQLVWPAKLQTQKYKKTQEKKNKKEKPETSQNLNR